MKRFAEKYLAAALFLLLYFLVLAQYLAFSPFARVPVVDADYYWKIAVNTGILGKNLPEMFFSAPLYPLALTAVVFVVGYSMAAVYVVQILAALATAILISKCAANVFSKAHETIAFVLVMAYFPMAFITLKILPEVLSLFLLALFLYFTSRPSALSRTRDAAIIGLSAGAAILVRSQYSLVVAAVFISLFWMKENPGAKFFAKRIVVAVAAALLLLSCWGLVNLARTGMFFISPPNGGLAFIQGNNPHAQGLYTPTAGLTDDVNGQLAGMVSLVSKIKGRPVSVAEANRYFFQQGLSFIKNNPGAWLRLEGKKIALALGPREPGVIYSMALEKRFHLPLHRVFFLSWPMLMAFFLLGLLDMVFFNRRFLRPALPCIGAAAALFAALLIFYVISRYRVLLLCPVAVVASHGVVATFRWIADRRFVPLILAVAVLFLSVFWTMSASDVISPASWNNVAYALVREGRFAEAEQAAGRVLAADPKDPVALNNMAISLLARKKVDQARPFVERLAENPAFSGQVEEYRRQMAEISRQSGG